MNSLPLSSIIFLLTTTFTIIWSFIFLPISCIGLKMHKISGLKMKKFLKQVKHASIWTNDEPDGWICGKKFFGYIHSNSSGERNSVVTDLYILTTINFVNEHILQKDVDEKGKTTTITCYEREGVFWRLCYVPKQIEVPNKQMYGIQQSTVNTIITKYQENKHLACLLYGPPGTGKSMTGLHLCAKLLETTKGVSYVDTFNPFEHGDNLNSLYTRIGPTSESPLVIMLEEIDNHINNLHAGKIEQKHHIPVQLKNKPDWNLFFDKLDRGFYQHVILIMTTNKSDNYFDELDKSYMRQGRVDLRVNFIKME